MSSGLLGVSSLIYVLFTIYHLLSIIESFRIVSFNHILSAHL